MGVFNGMFPILQGRENDARAFVAELMGAQRVGFTRLHQRYATREIWTIQQTPMGSFILVWFEGDVEKGFSELAQDDSEFATWFKRQIHDLTGVNLGAPPQGPMPEVVLEWSR